MVKAPTRGEADLDVEEPECLTDGSWDQLPKDYISKWKVTESNKAQRLKELEYTLNRLKEKGYKELVLNASKYDRDFYLICKGVYRVHNNKLVNRKEFMNYLIDSGLAKMLVDYWTEIIAEFEERRVETNASRTDAENPPLTTAQLWAYYSQHQKHIACAVGNCFSVMIVFWNGSDMKDEERGEKIFNSLVDFILGALDTYLHPIEVKPEHPQHKMVKACLSVLHNLCNKHGKCIAELRLKDALRIVGKYKDSGTSTLRTKSILTYSYLLTENDDQNKSVMEMNDEDIGYIMRVLRDAIDSPNGHSKKYGYHVDELIEGLNNIAVVDSNKNRLVDAGVLPLYTECLKSSKAEVQQAAANGLWALAFDETSLKRITDEPGCVDSIRQLVDSENPSVKAAAKGALWKLEGEAKHLEVLSAQKQESNEVTGEKKKLQHIMLSYNWESKVSIIKLRQRLKQEGYRVWIDIEQMSGSTLESMARAIENSAVVVPSLSEKYKASPACRQEAEYAHQLHKKLVPIRVQPKYRPDGWLGFLLGSTFFYDLTKPDEYEKKVIEFIKAVGDDAKILPGEDENPVVEVVPEEATLVKPVMSAAPAQPPTFSHQMSLIEQPHQTHISGAGAVMFNVEQLNCLPWTTQQVNSWLTTHKLEKHSSLFPDMDGVLLAELVAMRYMCPDVYYETMKSDLKMPPMDILRLNAAFRSLLK